MAGVDVVVFDDTENPPALRRIEATDVVSSQPSTRRVNILAPAAVWGLQHNLGTRHVEAKTFLPTGEETFGAPDWANATDNYLEIRFSGPVQGVAYVRAL